MDTPDQSSAKKNRKERLLKPLIGVIALVSAGVYALSTNFNAPEQYACTLSDSHRASLDKAIKGDLAAFQLLEQPIDISKDFAFMDEAGTQKQFEDWKGKTLLVNFWASWCAPCRFEMPALSNLQNQMQSERFEVLTLNHDLNSADKAVEFLESVAIDNLPLYRDLKMSIYKSLERETVVFYGLPTTLLVNDEGCFVGVLRGPAHWDSADAINLIKTAVNL